MDTPICKELVVEIEKVLARGGSKADPLFELVNWTEQLREASKRQPAGDTSSALVKEILEKMRLDRSYYDKSILVLNQVGLTEMANALEKEEVTITPAAPALNNSLYYDHDNTVKAFLENTEHGHEHEVEAFPKEIDSGMGADNMFDSEVPPSTSGSPIPSKTITIAQPQCTSEPRKVEERIREICNKFMELRFVELEKKQEKIFTKRLAEHEETITKKLAEHEELFKIIKSFLEKKKWEVEIQSLHEKIDKVLRKKDLANGEEFLVSDQLLSNKRKYVRTHWLGGCGEGVYLSRVPCKMSAMYQQCL